MVGNIYRPNNSKFADINLALKVHFGIIKKIKNYQEFKNCQIYIIGDLNIDLVRTDTNAKAAEYLEDNFDLGLLPLVTKPTRIARDSATLLDHFFTNSRQMSPVTLLVTDISDHFPILAFDET